MNKNKIPIYLFSLIASLVVGFFCAGFLHLSMTNTSYDNLHVGFLVQLLAVDQRFRMLYLMMVLFCFLCVFIFLLDSKPYHSKLKTVAKGIEIPAAAGQLQHGSARFMNEDEIDAAFASVILPKAKKADMISMEGGGAVWRKEGGDINEAQG